MCIRDRKLTGADAPAETAGQPVLVTAMARAGAMEETALSAAEPLAAALEQLRADIAETAEKSIHLTPPAEIDLGWWQSHYSDIIGYVYSPGTPISYPIAYDGNNEYYLHHDLYGNYSAYGTIFLDARANRDFTSQSNMLYGHHMENGRMFGDLDKYKDGAFFRQNTTGTLTLPGGSYRLEVLACLVVPASEQAIFAPGKWRSDAGGLLPFVEENALQMDAQALRALEEEPEGAQFLAMATCSGEYTDARTVVLARMEPMSDLQNGKEESLS